MAIAYEAAHLDELARIPVMEGLEWRPVRRRFGSRAVGTNAYTSAKVGDWIVEEHTEGSGHEELYVVLSGRARFTLDGEEVDAPAGTIVFIPDGDVQRKAVSEEDGTTVLAVGGWPDRPFEPSAWEWYFEADAQPAEEGIATIEDGLRTFPAGSPQEAALLYNLACIEARSGRVEDARGHLDRALELRPELRKRADEDPDLEALRA
jgi:mannose-6-phosphate isomerase-like protein (cupin superfamily)